MVSCAAYSRRPWLVAGRSRSLGSAALVREVARAAAALAALGGWSALALLIAS